MTAVAVLIALVSAAFLAAGTHEHRLLRELDAAPRLDHMRELRDAQR